MESPTEEKKLSNPSWASSSTSSHGSRLLRREEEDEGAGCFSPEGEDANASCLSSLPTRTVSYASEAQETEVSEDASCTSLSDREAEKPAAQEKTEGENREKEEEEAPRSGGAEGVHEALREEDKKKKKNEESTGTDGSSIDAQSLETEEESGGSQGLLLRTAEKREDNHADKAGLQTEDKKKEEDVTRDVALKEIQVVLFRQVHEKSQAFLRKADSILQQMERQEDCPSLFSSSSSSCPFSSSASLRSSSSLSTSASSVDLPEDVSSADSDKKVSFFSGRQRKAESDRALKELCAFFTLLFHRTFSASFWISLTSEQYSRLRALVFEAEMLQLKACYFAREWQLIRERADLLAFGDRDPAERVEVEEEEEEGSGELGGGGQEDGEELAINGVEDDRQRKTDAGAREGGVGAEPEGVEEGRAEQLVAVRERERREERRGEDCWGEQKRTEDRFRQDEENERRYESGGVGKTQPASAEESSAHERSQRRRRAKEETNRLRVMQWLEKRRRGALSYVLSHPKAMGVFRQYERLVLSRRKQKETEDEKETSAGEKAQDWNDLGLLCRGNKHACVPFWFEFTSLVFYFRGLAEENLRYIGDAIQSYKITCFLDPTNQDARLRYYDLCQQRSENEAHMLRCVRSMFDQKGLDRLQAVEEEIQRERETEYRRQDLAYRRELLRKSLQKGLAIV